MLISTKRSTYPLLMAMLHWADWFLSSRRGTSFLEPRRAVSSPVSQPLEVEPQLENVVVKLTPEAPFVAIFPLTVDNLERDV